MLPLRDGAGEEQQPRPNRGQHLLQVQKDDFDSPGAGMTPFGDVQGRQRGRFARL